jgi:hypothetical protein
MDNEDIRPPDQVKTDKLFDDDFYSIYNDGRDDLNTAIEMSKNEYNLLQEQLLQQQKERRYQFYNIKLKLSKILLLDKYNSYYYELILSIIEMYELCVINEYKTDEKEYLNIFKILQTIRLPIDEIENMKKIII